MRKVGNVASLHWLGIAFIALCWSDKKGSKVRSLGKSSYSVALLYTCCSNLRKYECSCHPAFSKIQSHVHLSKPVMRGDAELLQFILQSRSGKILFQHLHGYLLRIEWVGGRQCKIISVQSRSGEKIENEMGEVGCGRMQNRTPLFPPGRPSLSCIGIGLHWIVD